jgi:hypothetical protein
LEAVCDEQGIGGNGEYSGDNDAHLGRINVFTTSPLAASALFDLEPGVIGAVILSRAWRTFQPEKPCEPCTWAVTGPKATSKGLSKN